MRYTHIYTYIRRDRSASIRAESPENWTRKVVPNKIKKSPACQHLKRNKFSMDRKPEAN